MVAAVSRGGELGTKRAFGCISTYPANSGASSFDEPGLRRGRRTPRFLAMTPVSVVQPMPEARAPHPFGGSAGTPDRAVAAKRISWYTGAMSSERGARRVITSRVFRAGQTPPDDDWSESSVAERIDAVWELTRQCLEWTRTGTDEPRLQRSVSRVQRARR